VNETAVAHHSAEVLSWGLPRLRDLPWRRTRDPWAILVSEVMLQQTQVLRVVPKWLAFMEAFPTAGDCEVTRLGGFPTTLTELLALPGVGQYTARAVMAFAFEAEAAVVDTNIARVFARVGGQSLTAKQVQSEADQALPPGLSWEWNQCLMELGAVLCRPIPNCEECPLAATCAWRGVGPDPAIGSAGVSRAQSRFEGSERQARGRLLKALTAGSISVAAAHKEMSHPRAEGLLVALCSEGLVVRDGDKVRLP